VAPVIRLVLFLFWPTPTRAVYVEITEPERIVWTEPGSGVTTTSIFRDLGGERTEL
jgi:hypothetical protein